MGWPVSVVSTYFEKNKRCKKLTAYLMVFSFAFLAIDIQGLEGRLTLAMSYIPLNIPNKL